jgi:hypothetical protein
MLIFDGGKWQRGFADNSGDRTNIASRCSPGGTSNDSAGSILYVQRVPGWCGTTLGTSVRGKRPETGKLLET